MKSVLKLVKIEIIIKICFFKSVNKAMWDQHVYLDEDEYVSNTPPINEWSYIDEYLIQQSDNAAGFSVRAPKKNEQYISNNNNISTKPEDSNVESNKSISCSKFRSSKILNMFKMSSVGSLLMASGIYCTFVILWPNNIFRKLTTKK